MAVMSGRTLRGPRSGLRIQDADPDWRNQKRFPEADEKRRQVVPVAARRHTEARGQGRANLAYVCISGFNVGEDDARALGALIGDTPVRLDLIDVTDPTGRYQPQKS